MKGYFCQLSTSGSPARLVNIDNTPASKAVETTVIQSTSDIIVDTPMVATAVCATVLTALTEAAFTHCLM